MNYINYVLLCHLVVKILHLTSWDLFWQLTIKIRWKCSVYMLKMLQGIEFDFLKFSFEKNSMDKAFSISQKIKIRRSSMERESAPIMKSGPYWIELKIHNGYWNQCRPLLFTKRMLVKGSALFVKSYLTLKSNHPTLMFFKLLPVLSNLTIFDKKYDPDFKTCCVNRTYSRSS